VRGCGGPHSWCALQTASGGTQARGFAGRLALALARTLEEYKAWLAHTAPPSPAACHS
jgi:hypothetical protein